MKHVLLYLAVGASLSLLSSCSKERSSLSTISLVPPAEQSEPPAGLLSQMEPIGFTVLQKSPDYQLRSIKKVVFTEDGHLLVLDNQTDFQDVWLFSPEGTFVRKIGQQGSEEDAYEGLNDVEVRENEITLLAAGRRSLYQYDLQGNLLNKKATGAIGDGVVRDAAGNFYLYNEHSATEVSGYHYVLVYDSNGNLLNQFLPYGADRENLAYEYTGFITRSGNEILVNPPFGNTVYTITPTSCTPKYQFDFGADNVPEALASQPIRFPDVEQYGFLNEWLAVTGDWMQVEYQHQNRIRHGWVDLSTNQLFNLAELAPDAISKLISRSTVMPKGNGQVAVVLRPEQIAALFQANQVQVEALNTLYPGLGTALEAAAAEAEPVLIYLKEKQEQS